MMNSSWLSEAKLKKTLWHSKHKKSPCCCVLVRQKANTEEKSSLHVAWETKQGRLQQCLVNVCNSLFLLVNDSLVNVFKHKPSIIKGTTKCTVIKVIQLKRKQPLKRKIPKYLDMLISMKRNFRIRKESEMNHWIQNLHFMIKDIVANCIALFSSDDW